VRSSGTGGSGRGKGAACRRRDGPLTGRRWICHKKKTVGPPIDMESLLDCPTVYEVFYLLESFKIHKFS
jgi:hypothetical protein